MLVGQTSAAWPEATAGSIPSPSLLTRPTILVAAESLAQVPADTAASSVRPSSLPPLHVPPPVEGRFLRADRLQHAGLSMALTTGLATAGADRRAAALCALTAGVAKELYDARGGGASRLDLLADALGVGLGFALASALDL
jgi:uncharacterized protein YfiM (DUF2279 family)